MTDRHKLMFGGAAGLVLVGLVVAVGGWLVIDRQREKAARAAYVEYVQAIEVMRQKSREYGAAYGRKFETELHPDKYTAERIAETRSQYDEASAALKQAADRAEAMEFEWKVRWARLGLPIIAR